MAEDDWSFRNVQHLVHHLDGDVGQVDQHPQTVHFSNELLVRQQQSHQSNIFIEQLRVFFTFDSISSSFL